MIARLADGATMLGIVLWATDLHVDVWLHDGRARRLRGEAVVPRDGPVPEPLARVAAELRLHAGLAEGDLVRWERATGVAEGCIVEKCRYGAIIVTRDGKLVAVGFRRLWPAVGRGCA